MVSGSLLSALLSSTYTLCIFIHPSLGLGKAPECRRSYQRPYSPGPMKTSLRSRLCQMPHRQHITDEIKEMRLECFTLDVSSHQTGDAAFTPATPQDLQHSRANTDSQTLHNTQHTRVKQNSLYFMQKGTQPSQTCSGGHITPNPTQNRRG